MKRLLTPLAIATTLLLAACGGSPTASAPTSAVASSATAKPAASVAAAGSSSAKPAASAKPPASAAASAAAKPAAGTSVHIKSFYSTVSPTFAPLWIAKEAGIFQKNGLDVEVQLIQNPQGTAALLSNQVQIGLSGAADLLGPNTNGGDLVAMATMTSTYPYVFEVNKDIKTAADLKGKKIGASQAGGSDYVALLSVLGKLNLDFQRDVSILFVGGIPQRTAALLGGNIVGTLTAPPETLKVESQGFHSLVDVTSLNLPSATSTLTAHRAWVDANHAAVQKFVDSLIEAIAREKSDKAYAEQVMSKYLKLDDKRSLDAAYNFFALKILPAEPHVSIAQFSDTVENLSKTNPAIKSVDLSKVIDDSFVQDAVKRGVGK